MNDLQAALARVGELPEKWQLYSDPYHGQCADELAAIISQHLHELQACVRDAAFWRWYQSDDCFVCMDEMEPADREILATSLIAELEVRAAIEEGG